MLQVVMDARHSLEDLLLIQEPMYVKEIKNVILKQVILWHFKAVESLLCLMTCQNAEKVMARVKRE